MSVEPIDLTPPPRGWTVDDLDDFPEDGRRRELVDGVLLVAPTPTDVHQVIAARLTVALEETCPADYHVTQAVEVRINHRRSLIPDVLVTTDEAASRRASKYQSHEVVLAVEIVSDSSRAMDRTLKPALYALAGVPFFWRIEVADHLTVIAHRLDPASEAYAKVGEFTTTIEVSEPWPISIPVKRLIPRHLGPTAG
jgi:Uma2 family endonuclease